MGEEQEEEGQEVVSKKPKRATFSTSCCIREMLASFPGPAVSPGSGAFSHGKEGSAVRGGEGPPSNCILLQEYEQEQEQEQEQGQGQKGE